MLKSTHLLINVQELLNVWRWDEDIEYLDQGIFLFGEHGFICNVDWQYHRRQSIGTRVIGAVQHLGDILDWELQTGKQVANIKLGDLVRYRHPSPPSPHPGAHHLP